MLQSKPKEHFLIVSSRKVSIMKTNIIRAILNLVNNPQTVIDLSSKSHNRMNSAGESLEKYIENLFANTLVESDDAQRRKKVEECFSYRGSQNNPPDMILRNGDAIEVKKVENAYASLALNSSYPKAKLFSDSPMILKACKSCEEWDVKDIIYVIGAVKGNSLFHLSMVYGMDYAADLEAYERIKLSIGDGVSQIPHIDFADTKELGRVNNVDPLGITSLRIRGMWQIDNPLKVFNYIYQPDISKKFNLMVLINDEKYASFDKSDRDELERLSQKNVLSVSDVKIKDPNNAAKLKDAKLITFSM